MEVLEKDCEAIVKVSDEIAGDEEFRTYIDENINLEWIFRSVSKERIPQWIKDWVQ